MSKKKIDNQDLFIACKKALQWINNIVDVYEEESIINLMPNNWGGRVQMQEALQNHCQHPPERLYSWTAQGVLCVGCCECGGVLKGGVGLEDGEVSDG